MASKKIKKLLAAGLAGYAGAKMLGAGAKGSTAANVDSGRGGSSVSAMARKAANTKKSVYKDAIMRGGAGTQKGSIGMGQKIKNFLTKEVINIPKTPGSENFGLGDMDGAKYGKMIKANNGVMVEAKGNKLARSKATKIC